MGWTSIVLHGEEENLGNTGIAVITGLIKNKSLWVPLNLPNS